MKRVECKLRIDNKEKESEIISHRGPFLNPDQTNQFYDLYKGEIVTTELMNNGDDIYINCPDENINWMKATIRIQNGLGGNSYAYWYEGRNFKK